MAAWIAKRLKSKQKREAAACGGLRAMHSSAQTCRRELTRLLPGTAQRRQVQSAEARPKNRQSRQTRRDTVSRKASLCLAAESPASMDRAPREAHSESWSSPQRPGPRRHAACGMRGMRGIEAGLRSRKHGR